MHPSLMPWFFEESGVFCVFSLLRTNTWNFAGGGKIRIHNNLNVDNSKKLNKFISQSKIFSPTSSRAILWSKNEENLIFRPLYTKVHTWHLFYLKGQTISYLLVYGVSMRFDEQKGLLKKDEKTRFDGFPSRLESLYHRQSILRVK